MPRSNAWPSDKSKWRWTTTKYKAAHMLADGGMSQGAIEKKLNTGAGNISFWQRFPEFQAEIDSYLEEKRTKLHEKGIANQETRLQNLNDRYQKALTIIAERAAAEGAEVVPGGKTGLLLPVHKTVGIGIKAKIKTEYQVDTGLLEAIRKMEEQAAAEMGHWDKNLRVSAQPVVLVVAQGQTALAQPAPGRELPVSKRPEIPGVVIDLVPERR